MGVGIPTFFPPFSHLGATLKTAGLVCLARSTRKGRKKRNGLEQKIAKDPKDGGVGSLAAVRN
jgi:hypothetical protein